MFTTLAYSVAGGMLTVLATGQPRQLAWSFLRVVGVVSLALSVAAVAWTARDPGATALPGWPRGAGLVAAAGAAAIVFAAPVASRHPSLFRAISGFAGAWALAAGVGSALAQVAAVETLVRIMIALGQTLAGLLLGSITLSWLLGHAYLTATRMTIEPLRRFTNVLTWCLGARAAFVAGSVILGCSMEMSGAANVQAAPSILALIYRSWLIVFLRAGVGLLVVGVFAWMVRDCVRRRSTQSATGILYFGSLFAYVGELASLHLLTTWRWPV